MSNRIAFQINKPDECKRAFTSRLCIRKSIRLIAHKYKIRQLGSIIVRLGKTDGARFIHSSTKLQVTN